MLDGAMRDPGLAVNPTSAFTSLTESSGVRGKTVMVTNRSEDFGRRVPTAGSRPPSYECQQAVPPNLRRAHRSISVDVADLQEAGETADTQTIQDASSGIDMKRSPAGSPVPAGRPSNESSGLLEHWRATAKRGDADAQFNLGRMYADGEGVERDMNESIKWYRLAATNGHPEAQFNLGVIFTPGLGERRNIHEAISLYEQAFANGIAEAAHNLAVIYDDGIEVEKDSRKAIKWYTRAAENGLALSQHKLAVLFSNGTGVVKDNTAAFRLFLAAAEQGDSASQHNLAVSYDRGIGVNTDSQKAMYWYQNAADKGFQESQYWLGLKYAKGEGVKKNMINAFVWIRYASEQGHPDSQCLLSSFYYYGEGVFVDYIEAYKWLKLGLMNGAYRVSQYTEMRVKIVSSLSKGQLKRAEQSVLDWSKKSWNHLKPTGYTVKNSEENSGSLYRIIGPIKFIHKLLELWEMHPGNAVSLLGFDRRGRGYVDRLLQGQDYLVEGSETEDRIAYLFYIWSIVSELFRDRTVENEWLRRAEPELEGKTPMELILSGPITDLLLVKDFVDLVSGRSASC